MLSKLVRPAWWKLNVRNRNVPKFWWRYLTTREFPDDISSIEDLVRFCRRHKVMGFNLEAIRAYIFWRLHNRYECSSFVETGTLYGNTAAYTHKVFKTPVFTTELNTTHYVVSKTNLAWARGVQQYKASSPDFLAQVCYSNKIGNNPMFYLDAHWNEFMPLPDELSIIAEHCKKAVILIDDFMIPWDNRFLYDEYPDIRIDTDIITNWLQPKRSDISVFMPNYDPASDPSGKGIGFAAILMGQDQELPMDTFPFNLLTQFHDLKPTTEQSLR